MLRKEMERLIDKEGLISRIDYDESCKNSFFEAVDDWSRQLGNDLNFRIPLVCDGWLDVSWNSDSDQKPLEEWHLHATGL